MSTKDMSLLLFALLLSSVTGLTAAQRCSARWQRFADQSSVGATKYHGPISIRDCLQHCIGTPSCKAVDVKEDIFPPECWPHLNASSLEESNTYYLGGTNQYRLTRCSNVPTASCTESKWERYVGYTALGASQYIGPRTIRQCLDYCEGNADCAGVDIDDNVHPLRCWVHLDSSDLRPDNVYRQQNTSHYRLISRCPAANKTARGCYNPEWEVFVDQNSVGASKYGKAQSVQECLDYCGSRADCVATDVDLTQQPPTCWPHLSADDLLDKNVYYQPGTNQYRLRHRCVNTTSTGGSCYASTWKIQRGQAALGGAHYVGPRTIQQCLDYCNATAECVAVDVDVNVVPVRCWMHVNVADLSPDNVYSQYGTDHYQIVKRCLNVPQVTGCYNPEWEVFVGQNSVGASKYGKAQSVQECLDYCGSRADCVAVDVDLTQQPPTCWPHLSDDDLHASNVYSQPGTNQYRLSNRCATGGITETSTSTSTPRVTTSLGPNCHQSAWSKHGGQTALGGARYVGPRTIQQCLDYCNATAECVAVDVDVNVVPVRCWTHVNAVDLSPDNVYSQYGTDHYQLVKRCLNAPQVTACYNPEWEVFVDQNSVGASKYGKAQSVQECLDYCGSRADCVAVDVDLTQQPPTCWPHLSDDDLHASNVYSQPGTNQYRLSNRCATGGITVATTTQSSKGTSTELDEKNCRASAWSKHGGQAALGGARYVGPRTIQQCLDYCNATAECVAVDVDVNVVPVRCWTHDNVADLSPDNVYSQYGTDHYQLVKRCLNAPQATGCYNPEWEVSVDQNSVGASKYDKAQSVQECLDYCGSRADCVAVDVDLTQQPPTCWPHLSDDDLLDSSVYSQPGTNQYRLSSRCATDQTTVAAVTTKASESTNAPVGCTEHEWTLYKDQSAAGASKYSAAKSIQECLDFCVVNVDCVAVDVGLADDPPTCWPHFDVAALRQDNIYDQSGVNHYRLTQRCAVTTTTTTATTTAKTFQPAGYEQESLIAVAVGLGVPLFIVCVLLVLILCCILARRRRASPVEAVNPFFLWTQKTLNRRTGSTVSSSTSSGVGYPPHKDVEPLYDTPSNEHYQNFQNYQTATPADAASQTNPVV